MISTQLAYSVSSSYSYSPQSSKAKLRSHFIRVSLLSYHHHHLRKLSHTLKMSGNDYIVTFKESATPEQIRQYVNEVNENGGQVKKEFILAKSFAAKIPDSFLGSLKGSDLIDFIEPDQTISVDPIAGTEELRPS